MLFRIKGGLNHATRGLVLELAPYNVKVNAVAPGIFNTPLHNQDEGTQTFLKALSPSGTIGNPKDVVDAELYLTDSSFTSGPRGGSGRRFDGRYLVTQPLSLENTTMPYVNIRVTKEGVTAEQKLALIEGATELLFQVLGKPPISTFVVIDEVETDNWGWQGKTMTTIRKEQKNGSEE
ncbi:MAG: 3-oxoacyl-(acyl-carrier-protein) reductase [Pseudomonas sp.]|nr:3-oxoacyl-(acyl-carrier-protein) reductase [Pseudomonas sp.]